MTTPASRSWQIRLAMVCAAAAVILGIMSPVLGALHTLHRHHPAVCKTTAEHGPDHSAANTPGNHDTPRPDAPPRRDDCPVCLQLATALRYADPGDLAAAALPATEAVDSIVLIEIEVPSRSDRSSARPRAPPAAC